MYKVSTHQGVTIQFPNSFEAHEEAKRLFDMACLLNVSVCITVHDHKGEILRSLTREASNV